MKDGFVQADCKPAQTRQTDRPDDFTRPRISRMMLLRKAYRVEAEWKDGRSAGAEEMKQGPAQ